MKDVRRNPATGEEVDLYTLTVESQRAADPWWRRSLIEKCERVSQWPAVDVRVKAREADPHVWENVGGL